MHSWSQEKMVKSEQEKMWQMGSTILACAIPWGYISQDYALRRLIFPHIKANELYAKQMEFINKYYDDKYDKFAMIMNENGDWKNAEQLRVKVMNMRKTLLGENHPDTIKSMANIAATYRDQGRWNEAEQLDIQ